jgi:hypothetical protein
MRVAPIHVRPFPRKRWPAALGILHFVDAISHDLQLAHEKLEIGTAAQPGKRRANDCDGRACLSDRYLPC